MYWKDISKQKEDSSRNILGRLEVFIKLADELQWLSYKFSVSTVNTRNFFGIFWWRYYTMLLKSISVLYTISRRLS